MTSAEVESNPLTLPAVDPKLKGYLLVKRILDVSLCLLTLPFTLLLVCVLVPLISLDSPGSPFFVQERVGKDGRPFRLYKFRTMSAGYDDNRDRVYMQSFVAGQVSGGLAGQEAINKPIRSQDITRVGRVLRKTSLDELPQILNVLKGDMSLIGPRPNVPWEVECYKEWHRERLAVLPGISGLAQVHGRSSLTFDEIAAFDIAYVRSVCFRTDLSILLATARIVITRKGAL
jgi:lipopolysaccharide/colanic/teichoic acid biosynthesis glycosyltransferase